MAAGGRRSGRLFIIIAVVLILLLGGAVILFKDQLFPTAQPLPTQDTNGTTNTPESTGPIRTVEVIVLAQPVSLGTKITPAMLTKVKLLEEDFYPELYYAVSDVAGEEFNAVVDKYARYPLKEKVVLTQGMLSDTPVGSVAANLIPNGYVAIPIPITRLTSVSYALEPGDHVNVIASVLLADIDPNFQTILPNNTGSVYETITAGEGGGQISYSLTIAGGGPPQGRLELDPTLNKPIYVLPSEVQRSRLVSQTLIQDATILWVGDFPGPGVDLTETYGKSKTITTTDADGNTTTTTPPPPTVLTLIVSPQDAVTLNYLLLAGARLNLVLRSAGDTQRVQTEAVTLQFLMDQYRIPYPTKLPYGLQPRLDSMKYPDEIVPVITTEQ